MINSNLINKKLSIIIASDYSGEILKTCLEAVFANDLQNTEIIVVHNLLNGTIDNLITQYPKVIFIKCAERATFPVLWSEGIKHSAGKLVTIIDSTIIVSKDWVHAIIESHQTDSPVIGGTVEMINTENPVNWAAYFCEYGQFMLPLNPGEVDVLPGNNISFKREVLEKNKQFVEKEFWKTYLCQHLQNQGIKLMAEPAMLVYYSKSFKFLPFLNRRFHHGRCFAGMRVKKESAFMRLMYAFGTVLLPFVFLFRLISVVLQKKRFWSEFLLAFPISVLAILFWSIGETVGYLAGTGKSCEHIY